MLKENLIELYQKSFRENKELPALSDYFKKESFSYFEMAKEIAKLHLLFEEAGLQRGDKVALIGRNNPRWCIVYIATITYGAVIVPILQDFSPNDVHHIINHSDSVLLFAGGYLLGHDRDGQHRTGPGGLFAHRLPLPLRTARRFAGPLPARDRQTLPLPLSAGIHLQRDRLPENR